MTTDFMRIEDGKIISENTNYQGYTYDIESNICTPTNHRTIPKWKAVGDVFEKIVKGSSFMDIGASMGFFCFKALECGATMSTGIEANSGYHKSVEMVCGDKIKYINDKFPGPCVGADVVMALSLVHHLSRSNSLEVIADELANVTGKHLIIEWIGNDDRTSAKYDYNDSYSWEKMDGYLRKHFESVEFVNYGHHQTRSIYLCSI